MVGGTVIEVADVPNRAGLIYVDCANMPRGHKRPDTCAIFVERNETSEKIAIGDALWWQGSYAYWTPKGNVPERNLRCGVDFDIKIPRVGFSGVSHPARSSEA